MMNKIKKYSAFDIWELVPHEDKEDLAHKEEWININKLMNWLKRNGFELAQLELKNELK